MVSFQAIHGQKSGHSYVPYLTKRRLGQISHDRVAGETTSISGLTEAYAQQARYEDNKDRISTE